MITDTIIDALEAKYFCIFKDKKFNDKLDDVLSKKNEKTAEKLMAKAIAMPAGKKALNEFAPLGIAAYPAASAALEWAGAAIAALGVAWFGSKAVQTASKAISSDGNEVDAKDIMMREPPVDPAAYASHGNTVSYASSAVRDDAFLPAFRPQKMFNPEVVDAVSAASQAASSSSRDRNGKKKTSWWKMLLAWCGSFVTSFLGWLSALLAKFGIELSVQAIAGIISGVAALASYLVPRVIMWVKRAMKDHVVAEVKFATSAGDDINAWFSYDDFKWHVNYLGARIASRPNMPVEDKQQLLQTQFFKNFSDECIRTLHSIFDDDKKLAACASISLMIEDKDIADEYKNILSLKDKIMQGLENPVIAA